MRIEPKQINLQDLATALADLFTSNSTLAEYFVNSIQEFILDEKVKANSSDPAADYLINKIEASNTGNPVNLTFAPKGDNTKVDVSATLNSSATSIILGGIIQLYYTNTDVTPQSSYINSSLINKTILQIVREKQVLPTDSLDPDGYIFTSGTGTILFNTAIQENERLQIWAY